MSHFSDPQLKILTLLADGNFHSGTALATAVQLSCSAVWKHLQALAEDGLDIIAVHGKGYKLARPLELLTEADIRANLSPESYKLLFLLEIYSKIDSTNRYLTALAQTAAPSGTVCFAESQTAGKGRHGRQWVSPFGCNLYLSILARFQNGLSGLSGLSLAVGVAVIRALKSLEINEIGLKWPNDIVWQGKKLAGILIEVSGEASGECSAVVGLGLNLYLPVKKATAITQPWTDLVQILGTQTFSRNHIAAVLLNHLLPVLAQFETDTLSPYLAEWRSYDVLRDQAVTVYLGGQQLVGTVRGVNAQGLLLLETPTGELKTLASGEVSFRAT